MVDYTSNIEVFYKSEDYDAISGQQSGQGIKFKEISYFPRKVKRVPAEIGFRALKQKESLAVRDSCVYIHIPFCRLFCSYCGFYKQLFDRAMLEKYVEALLQEMDIIEKSGIARNKTIKAVFFGGGTPAVMQEKQITELLKKLHKVFKLAPECEITFESSVFDMTEGKLEACLDGGVNRFSFGVQTFNTELRRSFGRRDGEERLLKDLGLYVNKGAKVIIDLIYGLPDQTQALLLKDIKLAKEIGIAGLDLYKLQLLGSSILAKQVAEGQRKLITDMSQLEYIFLKSVETLELLGAKALSCCHWAFKPEEKSLYNTYVKQGMDNIAIGAACGGRSGLWKYMKVRDINTYSERIANHQLPYMIFSYYTPESVILNELVGQLDRGKLDLSALHQQTGILVEELLKPMLEKWESMNLLQSKPGTGTYSLTNRGAFWHYQISRNILQAMETALYGPVSEEEKAIMAKAISGMRNLR